MRLACLLVCLSALSLTACPGGGDDDDGDDDVPTVDASVTIDAALVPDAASVVDAAPADAGPVACTVSTGAFGDRGALVGTAQFAAEPDNAALYSLITEAPLEAGVPADAISVEFYTGYAPFGTLAAPTPVVPGTYALTGDMLNWSTCGVCVRVATNVAADGNWQDDYMVTGGTVTVTAVGDAVGETLAFSVSNLTFEHVTIDPTTFVSTPVADGCTTAVSAATFTGTVAAAP